MSQGLFGGGGQRAGLLMGKGSDSGAPKAGGQLWEELAHTLCTNIQKEPFHTRIRSMFLYMP